MAKKVKKIAPDAPEGEPVKPAKLPIVTRNLVHPDTRVKLVIVHDPNEGTYAETAITPDGKVTKTVHKGISHAWAQFQNVKAE
jgi:hypothetical protein